MKAAQFIQNAATCTLVLCAVVVTALLVRRELFTSTVPDTVMGAAPEPARAVAEWREYAVGAHIAARPDALVTIVEFSDFQCPFCRAFAARLDTIQAENPGSVALVYRHYPLPSHPHAGRAALASECAGLQGRFWEMHDGLFIGQDSIGVRAWESYAAAAGIPDSLQFRSCMEQEGGEAAIRRDIAAGTRLNVQGTPTTLINELRVSGTPPLDSLRAYIRRAESAAGRHQSRTADPQ
jgi:protein-disulfide isomerase